MRLGAVVVLLLVATSVRAQEIVPGSAPNCSFIPPPPEAMKIESHGAIYYIYPATDPGDKYTGCIHMWVASSQDGPEWIARMTTYYVDGQVSGSSILPHQSLAREYPRIECKYSGNEPVMQKGSEHKCTPAADVDLRMRLYR